MVSRYRRRYATTFYDPSRGRGWIVIREDDRWCGHLHMCFQTARNCQLGMYKNPRRGRGGKIMRSIGWDKDKQPRWVESTLTYLLDLKWSRRP